MTKKYLDDSKITIRLLLGLHGEGDGYTSKEDALYDIFRYMQDKEMSSISSQSLHYALKHKVDDEWRDEFIEWCIAQEYMEESSTKTKKVYKPLNSPFL